MASIVERLKRCHKLLVSSLSLEELLEVERELTSLMEDRWIDDENKVKAEWRRMLAKLKRGALAYFENGYLQVDYGKLVSTCDEFTYLEKPEKGYQTVKAMAFRLKDYVVAFNEIMQDAEVVSYKVRNDEWLPVTRDVRVLIEVATTFELKIESLKKLPDFKTVFGLDFEFPSVCEDAIKLLRVVADFSRHQAKIISLKDVESFLKEHAEELSVTELRQYPYYALLDSRVTSSAVVLSTPLDDEAVFFSARNSNGRLYKISAESFENKDADTLSKIFELLADDGANVVIFGLDTLGDGAKDVVTNAMRFAKTGFKAFLVDSKGDKKIYELGQTDVPLDVSVLDLTHHYLSLPRYDDVVELFEELGMNTVNERETVREKMRFVGFEGLNLVVEAFKRGENFWKIAERIGENNARSINRRRYLASLPTQNLFVDGGWGKFSEDVVSTHTREFNYDDVAELDKSNIRKIMEGRFTLYEKCGCLVRYVITAGADYSEWTRVGKEEQERRIELATKLVFRALDIGYEPVVRVEDELSTKGAGGLCCDGGKLILYKRDCIQNYAWLVDAILHESHHAFQHTAANGTYKDWYFTELGVTIGRKNEWALNHAHYYGNVSSYSYKVQVLECESRAFAKDCLRDSDNVWNAINFD